MILVTGARGWIAGRLLAALGAEGRGSTSDTRDAEAIADEARGCSAIVHLAFKNIDTDGTGFAANVEGTRVVADVARQAGVPLISLSTAGVYGHAPHHLADETTPLAPDTPLSRSRAAADTALERRHREGQPVLIVRHRFVLGPGDTSVGPRLHRVVARSPVWLDGGRARLSWIHVDDLVAVLARAARSPLPDEAVMHATSGSPTTLRHLGEALCGQLGGRPPRLSVPTWAVLAPVRTWERLRGIDPETSPATMSSIRIRLLATDQSLASDRQQAWWPDQTCRSLEETVAAYGETSGA